jgi:hypothetical protein
MSTSGGCAVRAPTVLAWPSELAEQRRLNRNATAVFQGSKASRAEQFIGRTDHVPGPPKQGQFRVPTTRNRRWWDSSVPPKILTARREYSPSRKAGLAD